MSLPKPPAPQLPWFMILFISMFGFVGLAVLIFLWSASSGGFGAPPLIFRVFGSFIAIAFMAIGFGIPITALRHRTRNTNASPLEETLDRPEADAPPASSSPAGYRCPHCGAGLAKQEVSPSGDVKCSYCDKWWNIHRTSGR